MDFSESVVVFPQMQTVYFAMKSPIPSSVSGIKKKVTFKFRGGIDASVIQCVECVKLSQYAT